MKIKPFKTLEELVVEKRTGRDADPGIVYAIQNEYMPGLIKIGLTRVGVENRIHSLSISCPRPWTVLATIKVHHVQAVEKALHEFFHWFRVDEGREFFRIEFEQVEGTFQICSELDGIKEDGKPVIEFRAA